MSSWVLAVRRPFATWRSWKFGASPATPVLLTGADQLSTDELPHKLAAADWNPGRNARDRAYLMPVITPCRPRLCAAAFSPPYFWP